MKYFFTFILYFFFLILSTNLFSQQIDSTGEHQTPKEVFVSIMLLDILKIDDVNKRMAVDFAIRMTWKDESLDGLSKTILLEEDNRFWHPEIQFLNSVSLEPKIKKAVNVKNGSATYAQRYIGDISIKANFSQFPFDKHEFSIHVVGVNRDSFTFINNQPKSFTNPALTLAEWDAGGYDLAIEPFKTQIRYLPGFEFKMQFKRRVQFYIWKTMIPLSLVIFMSWTVFWVHPKHLEAQIAITVTSMLTLVTFQFLLSNILPPLSYLTKMDVFIFGANFIVFLALIETVVSSYFYDRERKDLAEKIDLWSRYFFPSLLVLTYIAALLW